MNFIHHTHFYVSTFGRRLPSRLGPISLALLITLILLASIVRGGNRSVALIFIEWLSLALTLTITLEAFRSHRNFLRELTVDIWFCFVLVSSPLWITFLQWQFGALEHPMGMAHSALTGIPIGVCLAAALFASTVQVNMLQKLWLGVGVAQAIVGLAQLSSIEELFFGLITRQPVIGTYASKNTFANLLVMAMPFAVLGLWGVVGRKNQIGNRAGLWWSVLALVILLSATLASTSRTGIATAALVSFLALVILAPASKSSLERHNNGWRGHARLAVIGLSVFAIALFMSGAEWMLRFDSEQIAGADALRALTRVSTWDGVMSYWPLGSGLGSYRWVFPHFQAPEVGGSLLDLAHNEYLQILMETGLVGLSCMLVAMNLIVRRSIQLYRTGRQYWSNADRMAVASGLGLFATLLHAWVDYPFRIPANAMFAAFLMGVFLREPTQGHLQRPECYAQPQ